MKKVLTREAAPAGAIYAPSVVRRTEMCDALRPFLELVGTSAEAVVVDSLSISRDRVTYLTFEPVLGVEPVEVPCTPGDFAVWAWPVEVTIP